MFFAYTDIQNGTIRTIVGAADNQQHLNAWFQAVDGFFDTKSETDPFEHLTDPDLEIFGEPLMVFTHRNQAQADEFIRQHSIVVMSRVRVADRQKDMITKIQRAEELNDQTPVALIHNLDKYDPWDKRTEAERERDAQEEASMRAAQRDDRVTGDQSFRQNRALSNTNSDGRLGVEQQQIAEAKKGLELDRLDGEIEKENSKLDNIHEISVNIGGSSVTYKPW